MLHVDTTICLHKPMPAGPRVKRIRNRRVETFRCRRRRALCSQAAGVVGGIWVTRVGECPMWALTTECVVFRKPPKREVSFWLRFEATPKEVPLQKKTPNWGPTSEAKNEHLAPSLARRLGARLSRARWSQLFRLSLEIPLGKAPGVGE